MDIKTLSALGVRNLILRENGEIIDAWQQEAERYFNQYSVAKSFTAIACLQAVENGVWDLQTNVYDLVKDCRRPLWKNRKLISLNRSRYGS